MLVSVDRQAGVVNLSLTNQVTITPVPHPTMSSQVTLVAPPHIGKLTSKPRQSAPSWFGLTQPAPPPLFGQCSHLSEDHTCAHISPVPFSESTHVFHTWLSLLCSLTYFACSSSLMYVPLVCHTLLARLTIQQAQQDQYMAKRWTNPSVVGVSWHAGHRHSTPLSA